jgi:hypothetical protein
MQKFDVQIALEGVREARGEWSRAQQEFQSNVDKVLDRLIHEAATCFMSVEEFAKASGLSPKRVRDLMRRNRMHPSSSKTLLAKHAAEALATNSELLGIAPHEMDLTSPLAYLPMGKELRQELTDKTVSRVTELPEDEPVSGNLAWSRLAYVIYGAMPWEGETYQAVAETIAVAVLGEMGFCPTDGKPLPCTACGAGL